MTASASTRRAVPGRRKAIIFTDPFYYIDYCLAQIASLEIWDKACTSPKAALRIYDQLCVEGGNGTFLELLGKAGIESAVFHPT
jgi:oligoendopeptidase F